MQLPGHRMVIAWTAIKDGDSNSITQRHRAKHINCVAEATRLIWWSRFGLSKLYVCSQFDGQMDYTGSMVVFAVDHAVINQGDSLELS